VKFKYRDPTSDQRAESCYVYEDSIEVDGELPRRERGRLLDRMLRRSWVDAMGRGESLALIHPRNTHFIYRRKTAGEIEREREAYRRAARQESFLDRALAELDPTPYKFRFRFEDDAGRHNYQNGDWETRAMFWYETKRKGEAEALRRMDGVFNDDYPQKGMVFAIGNQAKRPKTWQLLAVIRLDELSQPELPFA
jgi:hypothetical protein